MKNTAKKIMALVFAVAMICTLAVPAFAADPLEDVTVTVISPVKVGSGDDVYFEYEANGSIEEQWLEDVDAAKEFGAEVGDTLHDLLKTLSSKGYIDYSSSKAVISTVKGAPAELEDIASGSWVVAVNGKIVSDYKNCVLAEGDSIVVYWYDSIVDTKLLLADYEQILSGVISYYYYDAEGNRQPVVGLNLRLWSYNHATGKATAIVNRLTEDATVNASKNYFTTDEQGQIWIAPEYLETVDERGYSIRINSAKTNEYGVVGDRNYPAAIYGVAPSADEYDEDLAAHFDMFGKCGSITTMVITEYVKLADVAGTAYEGPNTGDMTMVYVLVAVAAVVTLAAVVVMKKKAVKAN